MAVTRLCGGRQDILTASPEEIATLREWYNQLSPRQQESINKHIADLRKIRNAPKKAFRDRDSPTSEPYVSL